MNAETVVFLTSSDGLFHLLGIGSQDQLLITNDSELDACNTFVREHQEQYLFCLFSYELKNHFENLQSALPDGLGFPDAVMILPRVVFRWSKHEDLLCVQGEASIEDWKLAQKWVDPAEQTVPLPKLSFSPSISKANYLNQLQKVKQHIQNGDVYELNYCQEFHCTLQAPLPSRLLAEKLFDLTAAPFSAYVNWDHFEVFCGSPERFLQQKAGKLLSQPIKGTIRRSSDPKEDHALKQQLVHDPKERAENIMITDLVRNDLSRIAKANSVEVQELCGLYSFGTVHQLISSITATPKDGLQFTDILRATFPMGSMTGAPKIRAMQLIEDLESFKRGLYSGSIGYIAPNGDFDFNVVIRSLILDRESRYLSCAVGGAITIHSDPEKEYEECLTKVGRILNLFDHDSDRTI